MIVFKYFLKIAFDYKFMILGYAAIFFVLSIISSMSGSNEEDMRFQETKLNIGVINYSDSELSSALVDYLYDTHNIVDVEDDENYINEQIFLEVVSAVIIIPEDFHASVINQEGSIEIFRDDRRADSYQVQNQINKFIAFANGTYANGEFELSSVRDALDNSAEVNMLESKNGIDQEANTWFKYYYNFVSYVVLALYISVIGMIMTDFNVKEVEDRRKVSAIKFLKFNREIYLGQLIVAVILTSIFIVGSIILRGSYIPRVNFFKYVLNTTVFSFTALCLVFLIVNITTNKYAITAIGNVLSLGLSFISGVFVPQEFLGENVLKIARFSPIYYFVNINNKDIASILDIRFELFMQLLFGFAFLLIGLYFSKSKQKA